MMYAVGGEDGNNPGVSKAVENIANYKAVVYGAGSGFSGPSTSALGPSVIVKGSYKPVILMTAAESFFLQAEAKQRFPAVTLPVPGILDQHQHLLLRQGNQYLLQQLYLFQ